jgi:hypothetical protein
MVGDELGEKVVSASFRASGRLTASVLKKALSALVKGALIGIDKVTPNQQSIAKLSRDGSQSQGIEVDKSEMCGFDKYAKKYHFNYTLMRQTNDPDKYVLFFKARDISKLEMATRDFVKDKTLDNDSLQEKVDQAREKAFNINKSREKERTKSRGRDRGRER